MRDGSGRVGSAWSPADASAALAAGGVVLWRWSPAQDRMELSGPLAALGLEGLGAGCPSGVLAALLSEEDGKTLEALLTPRRAGASMKARLRIDGRPTLWRGAWTEDGVATGVVTAESAGRAVARDGLTGLLERRSFITAARRRLAEPGRYVLVVADLDRLRRLNEALGHERADLVLASLGQRLGRLFAAEDLPARVGEDEFAVLAPVGGDEDAGERLRAALEAPLRVAGFDIFPTLAIGAVEADGGPDAPEAAELLRRAELAVESAKTAGRGGGAAYVRGLESDGLSRLALEADLRLALERGQIEPFFQPVVRLDTGAVAGFEALMRWRHPRRGLLHPEDFIGLAEETGAMPEFGRHMIRCAARQAAAWRRAYPTCADLTVSVNLSTEELDREGLVEHVTEAIRAEGLPPGALELEITESQIMKNPDRSAAVLHALRGAGAGLSLDDFGTGFSSLSWLGRLPFDTLKIDRWFVRTMGSRPESETIVRSVADLGRELSLEVVAEGVESRAVADRLLAFGCHYGQGFGYAPGLSAEDADLYLAEADAVGSAPTRARA